VSGKNESKIIEEGLVKLKIPKDYLSKKHFFNPKVELSRDLTILVLNNLNSKDWIVCDALSGIGSRGVRIAKECKVKKVWLNDFSEYNIPYMKENVRLNRVKGKIKITNQDANQLFSENLRVFDYIDIDPWGSPTYFFDSAARSIKRKGFLGFSATDTAALSGTSPITCLRRYGIQSYKTDFFKELGLRILIASSALSFSKWSFSLKPLLSYVSHHYFRVFVQVKKGKNITSKNVKENLGYVSYCPKCLWRKIGKDPITKCGFCGEKTGIIGRVWIGKIKNVKFIKKSLKQLSKINWLNTENKIKKLLFFLENESIPLYYDIHKICKKHKLKIPRFSVLEEKLKKNNYSVYRTHLCRTGIKTDADLKILIKLISKS
jgi:tRNA (guanine26-N2/guanine27-N2)-dimethyltransferase